MAPRVSVFTPHYGESTLIDECYVSLLDQDYSDWEWVILLNNGGEWRTELGALAADDPRVRIVRVERELNGVGEAKREACTLCAGEYLVELDHDDYLLPTALSSVIAAFDARPTASLVYSLFAQVDERLRYMDPPFDTAFGWGYQKVLVKVHGEEREVLQVDAMDAEYPHSASLIWYAPNHLRAFRRDLYEAVGGYDARRDVLDDQDLMNRLYRVGEFVLIPHCLYLQRWTGHNTQARPEINQRIQVETVEQYDWNVQPNALAWAKRRGLRALDLGAAHNKAEGYEGVDQHWAEGVDHVGDIFDVLKQFKDSSVGVIRAVDFLEHITDKIRLMNELHRVLAHGGMLLSLTPSTDGRGAWQDPTHVSFWNPNAFWYFTQYQYARFVPEIRCRFQVSALGTAWLTDWHREQNIPYVQANLIALKGGPRIGGLVDWPGV